MTFDSGALIALEKGDRAMRARVALAFLRHEQITVPTPVLTEWWRKGPRQRLILAGMVVEPATERIAKIAGEALARVDGTGIDAIVMASAAQRGDVVYTSDIDDLMKLQAFFPSVRLFRA
jgi:predicted nucleic acid-binding protein